MTVSSVAGQIELDDLGRTLMHEHLVIGFPGWASDTRAPAPDYRNMVAACIDRVEELKSGGYSTLVDPCPNDLGRDVDLMGEVSARTGFNVIFATGLYNKVHGGSAYWEFAQQFDPDFEKRVCDMFVAELTEGVRGSGIKPGVIKVATGAPPFSEYEQAIFRAAAAASLATATPIMTHTDGLLGDEQVKCLAETGLPLRRAIIGHCCCNADHDYHMGIAQSGAFLGFDRFGWEIMVPDHVRVASLLAMIDKGHLRQIIVSHDSVCCWLGAMLPPAMEEHLKEAITPLRFDRVITPMLREAGITDEQIDVMLTANPKAFFEGARH